MTCIVRVSSPIVMDKVELRAKTRKNGFLRKREGKGIFPGLPVEGVPRMFPVPMQGGWVISPLPILDLRVGRHGR
jgi:hypothetical protein